VRWDLFPQLLPKSDCRLNCCIWIHLKVQVGDLLKRCRSPFGCAL
jgi:hypothetical protein